MRPTRHQWAMDMVRVTAQRATCLRRQVGCVLLNDRGHVLATGYNGVASGMPHCNDLVSVTEEYFRNREINDRTISITARGISTCAHIYACPGAQSPSGKNLDGCEAIHAEQNALLQCKDVYEIHSCYVSSSPCMTCAKLLLNTSCRFIYFGEEYPHSTAGDLWVRNNRFWIEFKGDI